MTTDNHTSDISLKRCSKKENCVHANGPWLPATVEYFPCNKRNPDGLEPRCRACKKQYYADNADRFSESAKLYRTANPHLVKEWNSRNRAKNPDYSKNYYAANRDVIREKKSQYNKANPEKARILRERFKAANPDYQRKYDIANHDKVLARKRRYRAEKPEVQRAAKLRHHSRKNGLPCTFTIADGRRMMEYWNYSCVYCGAQRDFWNTIEEEHWIAVTDKRLDNPGTVPTNIIPACRSCNARKYNTDPIEWVILTFSNGKAKQILAKVKAYFEWVSML